MSLTNILNELHIPYASAGESHHVTEGWIGLDCPYCSPSSGKFKLGVNLGSFATHCWSCSNRSLIGVLADITSRPWAEIKKLLGTIASDEAFRKPTAPKGKLTLPKGIGSLLTAHCHYLRSRNLDPDAIGKVWGVQGIGMAKQLAWRLFIPIVSKGKVVSWTTRAIGQRLPRYVNAPVEMEAISPRELLYGFDKVQHSVIVVEGPVDAWRLGKGAVATLGVAFSRQQAALLAQVPRRCVCFDSESLAQEKARELCRLLAPLPGETVNIIIETAKDAAAAKSSEIKKIQTMFLR